MAECDWEWGGVVETPPQPCTTPVVVTLDGETVTVTGSVGAVVADPLPVEEVAPQSFPSTVEADVTTLEGISAMGLGLILFFTVITTVFGWRGRHA